MDFESKRQNVERVLGTAVEERWEALRRRDPAADARFYYSVRSTGVYCRPTCAARPARAENVAFHDTAADAERAGFRPCKRCRPDEPPLAERRAALVARACRRIDEADALPDLDALAAEAGCSRFHFHRIFRAVTGITPKRYASGRRDERIRAAIAAGSSVTDAIYASAFGSSGRFYATADRALGMTATVLRDGGRGEVIRYAARPCTLGVVLVAATARGVCAILLGDDAATLVCDLACRFPRARLVADVGFDAAVAGVVARLDGPRAGLALPRDLRGTALQRRIWHALREIPAGSAHPRTERGRGVRMARAMRSVARARAAKPVAIASSCDRVMRDDGDLAGRRRGLERKRAQRRREGAA